MGEQQINLACEEILSLIQQAMELGVQEVSMVSVEMKVRDALTSVYLAGMQNQPNQGE